MALLRTASKPAASTIETQRRNSPPSHTPPPNTAWSSADKTHMTPTITSPQLRMALVPQLRMALARTLVRLPAPVRDTIWRVRWSRARMIRHGLEAKGDYSQSSPALNEMDRKLARHINIDNGFFVEAGANDGYHQSNTYWLERVRGWCGVLIEPVPALYGEAVRERRNAHVFNCALVPVNYGEDRVRLLYGGMMTTVLGARGSYDADHAWVQAAHDVIQEKPKHEFTVPGRTLSSILDEIQAPEIDLLSLDIEGFEPQALAGLDFQRHAPRWILVEIRERGSSRKEIEAILGERYVVVELLSPYDMLYRRRD